MAAAATVDKLINFAEEVLAADPTKAFRVNHAFNYFKTERAGSDKYEKYNEENSKIIYTGPGQARIIELKTELDDPRIGNFPQHNSVGSIPDEIELLPSIKLDDFENLHTAEHLEEAGFEKRTAILTKKKIAATAKQFANLSSKCFEDMLCLDPKENKRDFDVWVDYKDNGEIVIAYLNPDLELVQFFQTIRRNEYDEIVDLKHVVCEAGLPLVINQSCIDVYGNQRSFAHVGVTGSKENSFRNSLERYDDGSVVWTTSDYKFGRRATGAAVMKEDGLIYLVKGGDRRLSEFSARNLGAEGINPKTLAWAGSYDAKACVAEVDDKYIVRREYKTAVRNKVYQIIDGACIPGPDPVFDIR